MEILFFIMAALIVVSAIGVVSFRNSIYSALCLVGNLLTVAGLFALLDAHFLATVQIVVYAGAIMVLVIFLLMLLNIKVEVPKKMRLLTTVFAVAVGLGFLWMVVPFINEAFKVFPDAKHPVEGTVKAMGEILYTKYVFPFEITSVLILAALVGAVMLGKRTYRIKGKGV